MTKVAALFTSGGKGWMGDTATFLSPAGKSRTHQDFSPVGQTGGENGQETSNGDYCRVLQQFAELSQK